MAEPISVPVIESIVTTTGVLAGLLIVVLALVPDRRRRKLEVLYERFSSLKEKKIDPQISQNKELIGVIDDEIDKLNILNSILKEPLYVTVKNKHLFSLNSYNIILLSYVVFIFGVSLIFMIFVVFNNIPCEGPVVVLSVMTIVAFILIVPASYWSMVKDYPLGLSK